MKSDSIELEGLKVVLDRLIYYSDPLKLSYKTPHAFIYFLTIKNDSSCTIILKARKWVIINFITAILFYSDNLISSMPDLSSNNIATNKINLNTR